MRDQTDSRTLPLPEVASLPLTIDKGRLGDVWLPAFRREAASLAVMEAECMKQVRKRPIAKDVARCAARHDALSVARFAVERGLERTVEAARQRGGLLLCVVHA